jgi:hypothetical protein
MRCYFLRNGRLEAVELLQSGPDEALISEASALFRARFMEDYECFKVWSGRRFVYRSSDKPESFSSDPAG